MNVCILDSCLLKCNMIESAAGMRVKLEVDVILRNAMEKLCCIILVKGIPLC